MNLNIPTFFCVEVKSGETLEVDPGYGKMIHLSMACLGEVKKDKGEPVTVYVKFGDQRLVIGTLTSENFPQISYDLIFEKEFELSHNWKNGSVFFTGYKAEPPLESENEEDSEEFEDIPVAAANGNSELEVKNAVKLDANEAKQKEKIGDPRKKEKANEKDANGEDEEDSSDADSDESDEDSSEDEAMANGEKGGEGEDDSDDDDDKDEDDDDDDDDESDKEETLKKAELSKKRVHESSKKTPVPEKKAKFVTPEKIDNKGGVHVATPYPTKQAIKAAANNRQPVKQQTPKLVGDYGCKDCNRLFKTEDALNSHNKAKHSAK
ncbi:histone deacetylase HDT1 isoform X1 [Arachis duranensis]|uniref:Histone deacetylase HDT1 isoform X1 n=1 Tax=Arachis duranensis TaxID=130453 RepID=A0A9C6TBP1_ARADU|nr:histone deacetylase HDT1 isoform X1 [Arachis duranensis]